MTKVDIISGFLGAGKTTLIKKLLQDALAGTKTVLIENEFGEVGVDGGFLQKTGIEITEMNAGCICCSLVGDFDTNLTEIMNKYAPERILIEPSGVGKLSDVASAIKNVTEKFPDMVLNSAVTVVDVTKVKIYIKNFGEFYTNQIESAGTIILTRTDKADEKKIEEAADMIRNLNKKATIITTPIDKLDGKDILSTFEGNDTFGKDLLEEMMHDHDEEDEHECCCHHHDDDDEHECCHHHHDDEDEHEHHHHHGDEELTPDEEGVIVHHSDAHHHHHHHHSHGGHDADEVFQSFALETPVKYTREDIENMLAKLEDSDKYGFILRSKGIVEDHDGNWIEFDYVPEETQIREGNPDVTGKIVVIGAGIKEENIENLFRRRD